MAASERLVALGAHSVGDLVILADALRRLAVMVEFSQPQLAARCNERSLDCRSLAMLSAHDVEPHCRAYRSAVRVLELDGVPVAPRHTHLISYVERDPTGVIPAALQAEWVEPSADERSPEVARRVRRLVYEALLGKFGPLHAVQDLLGSPEHDSRLEVGQALLVSRPRGLTESSPEENG